MSFFKALILALLTTLLFSCGDGSTPANTPTNLAAVTGGDSQITLTWNGVSGADKYDLYYATETFANIDIANYSALADGTLLMNLTTNHKTITGLTNGIQYYFVVVAKKDNSLESTKLNEITATPTGMNDTGISWGNDSFGNNTTCIGENIAAQDCSHGRDARAIAGTLTKTGAGAAGFDFTKLGATGNLLAVQNQPWALAGTEAAGTQWGCVKDNITGLVWEVKTDAGLADNDTTDSNHTNIHHKDNTYRWGGKTALGKAHADKQGSYYDDWTGLVDGSNAAALCGFNNWRVPTIGELRSIVHYGVHHPAIDTHYFPNTTVDNFFSSSPVSDLADNAWKMDFSSGYGYSSGNRTQSTRVRLVRP